MKKDNLKVIVYYVIESNTKVIIVCHIHVINNDIVYKVIIECHGYQISWYSTP